MEEPSVLKEVIFYHGAFVHYVAPEEGPLQPQDPSRKSINLRRLAGFSDVHFLELCIDMYDELQRRTTPNSESYLYPRDDIHWKRNNARKHVATLPTHRFKEICRDLVTEQERRHPELKTGPTYPLQDSMPMATRSWSSLSKKTQTIPVSNASTIGSNNSTYSDNSKLSNESTISSPNLRIQSVSQSRIVPAKVLLVESDNEDEEETNPDNKKAQISPVVVEKHNKDDLSKTIATLDSHNLSAKVANIVSEKSLGKTKDSNTLRRSCDIKESTELNECSVNSKFDETSEHLFDEKNYFDDSKSIKTTNSSVNAELFDSVESPLLTTETPQSQKYTASNSPSLNSNKTIFLDTPMEYQQLPESNLTKKMQNFSENDTHSGVNNIQDLNHTDRSSDKNENAHKRSLSTEDSLKKEIKELKYAVEHQKSVTERVREESARHLEEMRSLTEHHEQQILRFQSTDAELTQWKQKYENLLRELNNFRKERLEHAVTIPALEHPLPSDYTSSEGKINPKVFSAFFNSIGAMVSAVHNSKGNFHSQDLLNILHRIILNAREVSREDQLISTSANQLITVVRNYTVSVGIFPVILVDGACSDLTMAVIDYAKRVKIKTDDELADQNPISPSSKAIDIQPKASLQPSSTICDKATLVSSTSSTILSNIPTQNSENNFETLSTESSEEKKLREVPQDTAISHETSSGSIASISDAPLSNHISKESKRTSGDQLTTPPSSPRRKPQHGPQLPIDESVKELRTYLEENTSDSVDAIGAILTGIKSNSMAGELKPLIDNIQHLVDGIITRTNETIKETRSRVLKDKGTFIVQNLKDCLVRLKMLQIEELSSNRDDSRPNRYLKQRLAGVNFDMAKSIKELVKSVEEVVLQEEVDDIDRKLL